MMTLMFASGGSCRIHLTSVKPSTSGICTSDTTRRYGLPVRTRFAQGGDGLLLPDTSSGRMPQLFSISQRISRLVALSSTISTGVSWANSECAGNAV